MDRDQEIERLVEPVITELGYDLVRVQMGGGRRATLQIMAERHDRRGMRVEDCARISRAISVLLDEADPVSDAYELEVSSPGLDRPLMKAADYERFTGHDAKVEIDPPVDGRKRFQGTIDRIENGSLVLNTPEGVVALPLTAVRKGKLVLTDRLLAQARSDAEAEDGAATADADN